MMTEHEAIVASIEHWERMIKWAEEQDPGARPMSLEMIRGIGKRWTGQYCPLCQWAAEISQSSHHRTCTVCTLWRTYGLCENSGSANAWSDVNRARSWGEWLVHARRMLVQLKSLLPEGDADELS